MHNNDQTWHLANDLRCMIFFTSKQDIIGIRADACDIRP